MVKVFNKSLNLVHCILVVALFGCGSWSKMENRLTNKHLKVVAVPWSPFFWWKCPGEWRGDYVTKCPNGEDNEYSGIMWELLMFMSQARNLSYTIMGIDDAWWGGTCFDVNNCTGMIGRVNRHEADFALGLYITASPLRV